MVHTVSYAFRNDDTSIMTLDSIGWQIVSSEEYCCPSDDRPDPGHVVFQYTLNGQGYLDIDNQTLPLPKGMPYLSKSQENIAITINKRTTNHGNLYGSTFAGMKLTEFGI